MSARHEESLSLKAGDATGLSPDFQALFDAAPTPLLVVRPPDWTIVAANDARLCVTGTTRQEQIGKKLFDVFPDDPNDPDADGARHLSASLDRVVATRATDTMPIQRYSVQDPDGRFIERWWALVNTPVLDGNGDVELIIHQAEEVTDTVRMSGDVERQDRLARNQQIMIDRLRASEAALRESEERFRNMADHAPVAMWMTDAAGYCTYLNRAWYQLTGQTIKEAEGFGWLDATHPDDKAKAERVFLKANATQAAFRLDYRVRDHAGAYRWAIDAAAPRFGRNGEFLGYIGSVIDIDDRRKAEEELRASEERLLALAHASSDVLYRMSPDWGEMRSLEGGGFLTDTNDPSRAWLMDYIPEDDREVVIAAIERAIAEKSPFELEHRVLRADRTVGWTLSRAVPVIGAAGEIEEWFGAAADVTARRQAEESLRESEARLRTLNAELERKVTERAMGRSRTWQLSTEIMGVANAEGYFEQSNPAWQDVLGWSEAELASTPLFDFVHPDDLARTQEALEAAIEHGEPALRFENRYRTTDGGWRWLSWVAVPDDGKVYCSARDITDEKAQAEALTQAEEALRQSQKLEAMGQLTGGVAHDFNNLLTPIMGGLDTLQRREVGDDRTRRIIDGAMQSAERAKTLVQRLLAFARRQPLQPRPVDVGDLVTGMTELIGSTIGPAIEIVVDLADDLPSARADANQVEMALLNLAVNARDAMPDGGRLSISATHEVLGDADKPHLAAGQYVRLCVADTGAGMDAETVARAIEPFFSTKGVGKGTGLGLSMVHGLATQLGGGLLIASEPGEGTAIDLWLPASAEAASGSRPAEAGPASSGQGTVLLVDDEVLIRMGTADMLEDLGYEVVEAGSAEDALRQLDEGLEPDLMLTDHLMPGMSGAELIRTIRSSRPGLPVAIVSGYSEVDGVPADIPRLIKPFRNTELAECLTAMSPGS